MRLPPLSPVCHHALSVYDVMTVIGAPWALLTAKNYTDGAVEPYFNRSIVTVAFWYAGKLHYALFVQKYRKAPFFFTAACPAVV